MIYREISTLTCLGHRNKQRFDLFSRLYRDRVLRCVRHTSQTSHITYVTRHTITLTSQLSAKASESSSYASLRRVSRLLLGVSSSPTLQFCCRYLDHLVSIWLLRWQRPDCITRQCCSSIFSRTGLTETDPIVGLQLIGKGVE